jgi:NADH:ubiquinone oxidoreductase subunit E
MKKITITVCLGTTCHLLGASHFQMLQQDLPAHLLERVTIEAKRCLGLCSSDQDKAPFVAINGVILKDATLQKIIDTIDNEIEKE